MESSDGEIKDDFSDISEEDYFDSIASKIEKRKLELELLNQIEAYGKLQYNIICIISKFAFPKKMTTPRKIETDKTRVHHPVAEIITSEERNPENRTMKYVIVLIALLQYFRQVIHYQNYLINGRGSEEDENTLLK